MVSAVWYFKNRDEWVLITRA